MSHAKSRPHFITGITLWVAASAVLAQLPRTAPLSPEFAAYAAKAKAGQLQTTADGKHGLGGCPSPVDMSYLSGQIIQPAKIGPLALATSYDLRTTGRMTAVKNQGTYGTCWAHATMGVLESCLMPAENQDFSENNLVNLAGFDWGFNYGGNAKMAMAYLARWGGPVRESDDPYPNPGGSASGLTVRKHVQQTRIIPPRTGATGNDAIKQAIMDYGALLVNYCHSDTCYNSTNKSYYYSGASPSNHYVVIAGWDDNYAKTKFSTAPAGNGAYIVRNSWGANWGENGYFYVSYYDTKFAYGDIYAFSNVEPTSNYSRIYSYDPLGWIGNFGSGTTPTYWAANVFTSTANENLGAVGFYATGANASYAIYIYTGVTAGSPRSGTLAATQTGTCQYPGYYTINLTTPATLTTNGRFSIVLQMTTPGNNYPQAIEKVVSGYSSAATAAAGQSYYSDSGGSWTDLTTFNATTNFCIKGYALQDTTPPTVTINQAAGQSDPANTSPINYTVVFSEAVADFATGDVTITGTAPGTKTATVTGSGTTYNVAVSGMTGGGTVIAEVASGVAHDAAGNGNTASSSTDNTVTYDKAGPTFTATAANPSLAKLGTLVTITFTASETLTANPLVTVNTRAAGYVGKSGNNYTYSHTIQASDADGDATIAISGTDTAGNSGSVSNTTALDVDKTAPMVTPPANVTVAATSGDGALVNYPAATASDPVGVAELTYSQPSGTTFPPGSKTVTVTARDAANNISTAAFIVTVTPLSAVQKWRQLHFNTIDNTGNAADTEDPNGNGIINLVEYALGGDPIGTTTGTAILPQLGRSASNTLQLGFTRYPDRTDLTLTAQAADSLAGPWTDLARSTAGAAFVPLENGATAPETGTGSTRNVIVTDLHPVTDPAHPRRFMRLQIIRE